LVEILNRAIANMTDLQKRSITRSWLNAKVHDRVDWILIGQVIGVALLIIGIVVTVITRWNRRLAREINERRRVEIELKEAKEVADQANSAKSEFLSSMSHELRTPLNAIMGFSQLLGLSVKEPLSATQKRAVDNIYRGGNHLLNLINEVLDLAKIEAGKLDVFLEPVAIGPVFEECVALIKAKADEREIKLNNLVVSDDDRTVQTDLTRFKQILLNLLSNAVKYNRDGGQITLQCQESSGDMLRIGVRDTGDGIPVEKQKDLFQPFNRLGAETTEIEGTGIGLVLTKQIVEQMGGYIGFESVEGDGSTFWFELPLAQGETAPSAVQIAAETGDGHQKLIGSIFYVEDNPANLTLMEMLIASVDGLTMMSAHNAELGLDIARSKKPDVIIMDINLPGMNGFQALEELRKSESTRDIPVIALSAEATPSNVEAGYKAGFNDYLTKPVDLNSLIKSIESAMEERG
jgi:signal transduction histidine kinase/CheY-like chemotaxis protein